MNAGSLFSGIGGLDLALEACGVEVKWQVENDKYCNKVLERHWPDVRRYSDMRTTDFRELEHVDLVFGGFPCQPFSVAGKNRGECDERNMWPDTFRAIRQSGCKIAFMENVPNLLTYQYFGTILADLASIGFNAEWDCFTASEVGAPHRRKRLYILAYARRGGDERLRKCGELEGTKAEIQTEVGEQRLRREIDHIQSNVASAGCQHQHIQQRIHGAEYQGSCGQLDNADVPQLPGHELSVGSTQEHAKPYIAGFQWPPSPGDVDRWAYLLSEMPSLEPALCRMANGIPDRTHRLKTLGNAVVPATGELAFRTLWERIEIT